MSQSHVSVSDAVAAAALAERLNNAAIAKGYCGMSLAAIVELADQLADPELRDSILMDYGDRLGVFVSD